MASRSTAWETSSRLSAVRRCSPTRFVILFAEEEPRWAFTDTLLLHRITPPPPTAFRPLLFRDLSTLGDSAQTGDVPTLILLHHVLARGGLPLPHQVRGWSETEYVRWLNEHQEEERIRLIEEVVEREREKEREKEKASPNGRAQQEEEETGGDKEEVEAAAEESETGRVALEIVSKVLARGTSSGNAARR